MAKSAKREKSNGLGFLSLINFCLFFAECKVGELRSPTDLSKTSSNFIGTHATALSKHKKCP